MSALSSHVTSSSNTSLSAPASTQRVVCILCPGTTAQAGGIGQFVANLETVLPQIAPGLRFEVVDTRGSQNIVLAPLFFIRALARITWLGLTGRLGLLHVNLSSHGSTVRKLAVTLLAALLRAPIVLHLHGSRFDRFYRGLPGPAAALVRWMFRRACHIVVLGHTWRRFVIDELHALPDKVEVIANSVFAPAENSRPVRNGVQHLLFTGRLGDRKGVPELLAALATPALAELDWHATIAGDGDVARFREIAQRAGLGDRVAFPGWVDRPTVNRLLATATVFILPSYAEGLPMSVLEALAHGVPVVATPVGALPDFLSDGNSALLVPVGDAEALAQALAALIRDPALQERLSTGGHAVFRERFDIAKVARRFCVVYHRCGRGLLAAGAWGPET